MLQEKILLVDDEPEVLSALRIGLCNKYKIYTSCNAEDALELVASEGPFPVIMSDLKMPGINGLDFLERASALSPESSAILLTGQGEIEDAVRAVNSGIIFKYLSKPCARPELNDALLEGIELFKQTCQQKIALKEHRNEHKVAEVLSKQITQTKTNLGDQVECHVISTALKAISGDFYEIVPYKNDCYDIIIGDVMGKGLSAALAGIAVKNVMKLLVNDIYLNNKKLPELSDLLHLIEMELHSGLVEAETFITLFYLRIDLKSNRLSYINRGHPGALLLRENGESIYLGEGILPLGVAIMADQVVHTHEFELNDKVILYSDGISEAISQDKYHPFEAIVSCLGNNCKTPQEIIRKIEQQIAAQNERNDDMTMMVLKINSTQKSTKPSPILLRRNADELFRFNKYLEEYLFAKDIMFSIAAIECFTNIVRHTVEESLIEIEAYTNEEGDDTVIFSYEGEGFVPEEIRLPDCSQQVNGFGLYLIERICKKVEYFKTDNGWNRIKLIAKEEGES
ncbi:MAG: SpoIIE family protein phosphatase [Lentisphaerales bacterium]|nr:SpoIIE family protein phosphatase [Lentisphaerales bacterium]